MRSYTLFITMLYFISCTSVNEISNEAVLISNINIVEVESGEIYRTMHMVIDSGKIKKITARSPENTRFNTVIDGSGKYIMPGLSEMHAHIPGPNVSEQRRKDVLFLYLSQGITTIRGMLGDTIHIALREAANQGDIISPRIFTASPSLNGNSVQSVELLIHWYGNIKRMDMIF